MKALIPKFLISWYHLAVAWGSAILAGFPSRNLTVVAVTGTKGKSTVVELINAILEENGHSTIVSGTIRFKVAGVERPNKKKMTMPGRGFLQNLMKEGVEKGATHMVFELTTEGARQFRHHGIDLNALVFTNLHPEHIESHGSFQNYITAKVGLGKALVASPKRPRIMVSNLDDERGRKFLDYAVEEKIGYRLGDVENLSSNEVVTSFSYKGVPFSAKLPGIFNASNMLAAIKVTEAIGVPLQTAAQALLKIERIPGRVEYVHGQQAFDVIVDYAHTPDSLEALYSTFKGRNLVCVLGNTGGGRDLWKRPVMGHIAEMHCDHVILTDEDPYDENPEAIVAMMADGMKQKKPTIVMNRREALREAFRIAGGIGSNAVVLVTGKGTDPYIMRAHGEKEVWSDRQVCEEELATLQKS